MKKLFLDLYNSFFNNKDGFAGRKLTGFGFFVLIAIGDTILYSKEDEVFKDLYIEAKLINVGGLLLCLGLVTWANLVEFRTGIKTEKTKETTTTETSKTEHIS